MSSTDKAFIKAYTDKTRTQNRTDNAATESQSFVVGPRHFRVSQFVTAPASSPVVSDPTVETPQPSASDPSQTNRIDTPDGSTTSDGHETRRKATVDIRLDDASQSVVPAPHFSTKSFANKSIKAGEETNPSHQQPTETAEVDGELELIELRMDLPETNIVPAPHFAVGATDAKQAARNDTAPEARQADQREVTPSPSVRPLTVGTPTKTANTETRSSAMPQLRPNQVASPAPLPVRETPALNTFVPAWEVDSFQWPAVCGQLDSLRSKSISEFVRAVLADAWQGTRVVAVTEFGRGEGATTLSLCLAKWAAMFTGRVAIVDGDIMQPRIADSLGIAVGRGWEESSHEIPVCETAVASVEDRLVALPLGPKSGLLAAEADRSLGANMLRELAGSFELVVLDAGPMFDAAYHWFAEPSVVAIDSVFVVQDVRSTSVEQVSDVRRRLVDQGLNRVSIVENFRAG